MNFKNAKYFPYILATLLLAILYFMVQSEKTLQPFSARASFAQEPGYFYLPPGSADVSEVTVEQYRSLIAEFQMKYIMPVYKVTGKALLIPQEWDSPYFAGFSIDRGNYMQVSLWGGTARAHGANLVILAGILCHEVGHIIGGAPHQTIPGAEWSSSEGQSDFFAARECLPEFLKNHPELIPAPDEEALNKCDGNSLCARTVSVGLQLVRFLQKYDSQKSADVSLRAQAPAVKETLVNAYPSAQCRLDTYVKGAQCQLGGECRPPACWIAEQ